MAKKKKKQFKLSACMIVKNEEAMLARCLNSIQNIVDEIIVVDTGSTDNTVAIAQSFNAKVFHHPWEEDFSKHRNQSISYATGDWFLVIDADEELDNTSSSSQTLKETLRKTGKKFNAVSMTVADKNQEGELVNQIERVRIFRNNVGMHYQGIVHNTPVFKGGIKNIALKLFHYGYALSDPEMQRRFKRTTSLLHRRLEQNPKDIHACFYLSQLHIQMNQDEQGIKYAKKCLTLLQTATDNTTQSHEQPLDFYYAIYHILATALIQRDAFDEALDIVREGLAKLPKNMDLLHDLATIGFFLDNPELTIEGGEPFLNLLEEENTPLSPPELNLGNGDYPRPISTTTPEAIFSVKYWLMTAYLALDQFDTYEVFWSQCQDQFVEIGSLHEPLLTTLEKADAWNLLEQTLSFLVTDSQGELEVSEKKRLQYEIFLARKKETYDLLNNAIESYLALSPDYEDIPLSTLVILAEYFLNKNDSKAFITLSAFLLPTHLMHKPDSLKNTEKLSQAYRLLAQQQDKTDLGSLTSIICSKIAWILTDDSSERSSVAPSDCMNKKGPHSLSKNRPDEHLINSVVPACFRTAFAEFNITPQLSEAPPVYLQGIPDKERVATTVANPLRMQILLIETKNSTKLLLVSADLYGFGNEMVDLVKKEAAKWGVPQDGIILNASGTLNAPGTLPHTFGMGPYFQAYSMEVAGIISSTLQTLHNGLEETHIYSKPTDNKNDTEPPILLLKLQKSRKQIIIVNPSRHAFKESTDNTISAGLSGYCREMLLNTTKADCVMFLQGAVTEPFSYWNTAQSDHDNMQNICQSLVHDIALKIDTNTLTPLTVSDIAYHSREMFLPLKKAPSIEHINGLKNNSAEKPIIREWASRLSNAYPAGDFPNALSMPVNLIRIGNTVTFICFPAGIFPDLASQLETELKQSLNEKNPTQTIFILGYTNGFLCYVPDDQAITKGDYDVEGLPYHFMIPYLFDHGTEKTLLSNTIKYFSEIVSRSYESKTTFPVPDFNSELDNKHDNKQRGHPNNDRGLRISDGFPQKKDGSDTLSTKHLHLTPAQDIVSSKESMDFRGKKFIVIGGAGFIGSHLVGLLTKEDVAEIRIFDNFTRGCEENIAQALKDPRVKVFELGGDLLHRDILDTAMKGMDGVFHLAALWLLHCHDFPRSAFEVNMGGTFNVLEAMLNNGVRRLVYSSSASVYGDAVEEPMTEDHPYNNTNFYGATKIAGEQMCRALYHRYKDTDKFFNYTGLRYMNVYGPRQDYQGAYIAVIMKILDRLDQGLSPLVYGDGSQAYDFIYVEDCAQANIDAMKSNATDAFYNVGTGIKTSIKELTELLIEITGSEMEIQYEPAGLTFVKNRVGSPVKAENEIAFKSKNDLREGLIRLIEWRNAHKKSLQKLRTNA